MNKIKKKISRWVNTHYINLAIFNTILVILALLNNAKYFDPYWLITVNIIVLLSLILSIILLGANSTSLFIITMLFLTSAGTMRILGVLVWAERISIYVFESLFLSILLLFFEYIYSYNKKIKYGKS